MSVLHRQRFTHTQTPQGSECLVVDWVSSALTEKTHQMSVLHRQQFTHTQTPQVLGWDWVSSALTEKTHQMSVLHRQQFTHTQTPQVLGWDWVPSALTDTPNLRASQTAVRTHKHHKAVSAWLGTECLVLWLRWRTKHLASHVAVCTHAAVSVWWWPKLGWLEPACSDQANLSPGQGSNPLNPVLFKVCSHKWH